MRIKNLILSALFAALIAIGTLLRIQTPLVPVTMQTAVVTLAGLMLGAKYGALSAVIYMVMGLIGLPVFTGGGGFSYVLRPEFGYIIGFVFGAFITGLIAGKSRSATIPRLLAAGLAGLAVIYLCGTLYCFAVSAFYLGKPLGLRSLLLYGFLIFIPGDSVMCACGAFLAKRLNRLLHR